MLSDIEFADHSPDHAPVISAPLRTVVAIPVCDEEERIGACLSAISDQVGIAPGSLGILLFLNNCRDDTAAIVAREGRLIPFPMRVLERTAPDANAGWARRQAMDEAARWLREYGREGGVILTTDADSRVPPDWVRRNLSALAAGADAVAGGIALDPEEAARLPASLHARGRLESSYESLLVELGALLDPIPHDPWPCHWTDSGASLCVTLDTYLRVGGLPAVAIGEDKAFVARLAGHGARVRHAPDIAVVTSGRLEGRAPGGAADTMRLRCEAPDALCDPRLEALPTALWRYAWRRRLRGLHASGRLTRTGSWAPLLGIGREEASAIARLESAGQVLQAVEAESPLLAQRPLGPRQLPSNIRLARAALAALHVARRARTTVKGWTAGAQAPATTAARTTGITPGLGERMASVGSESAT